MLEWIKQTFNVIFGSIDNKKIERFDVDYEKIKEIDDFHSLKPQSIDYNQEMHGLLDKLDVNE
jgi:hypothetical protein